MQPSKAALRGCRVLVTRSVDDAEPLLSRLQGMGAEVLILPTFEILPPLQTGPLDDALSNLSRYDWVAFTSRHAVDSVFQRLDALGLSLSLPTSVCVAAIGSSTAAKLKGRGVNDMLVPDDAHSGAVGLGESMGRIGVEDKYVLLPAGNLARPELRTVLEGAGATVHTVTAYRSGPPHHVDSSILEELCGGKIDVISVASPSAINNLAAMLGKEVRCLRRTRVACIGTTTAKAIARLDPLLEPIVANSPSVDNLIDVIVSAYLGDR